MTRSRCQSNLDVTPCKFAVAETPAELGPSRPPRARPSPSDAPARAFCRSFSRPSSSQAWRSSSAVKPMIGLCDDIVAGRDQPGNKRRTDATKPEYQPTRRLSPWAYRPQESDAAGERGPCLVVLPAVPSMSDVRGQDRLWHERQPQERP